MPEIEISEAMGRLRDAHRALSAALVASAHRLDQPFPNAPDLTPWTRISSRLNTLTAAVNDLDTAVRHTVPPADPDEPVLPEWERRLLERQANDRWRLRSEATGGGPCGTCGRPFWTHVCLSCSPDAQSPGPGCANCRNTGMDQTPCATTAAASAGEPTPKPPADTSWIKMEDR